MTTFDKYGLRNIQKLHKLIPDFSESQLMNVVVDVHPSRIKRLYDIIAVNAVIHPYIGQRYVLIGDWVYIVKPRYEPVGETYVLHIEHTLDLSNLDF